MKIKLCSVGKIREGYLLEGEAEYSKRLSKYSKVELLEFKNEEALSDSLFEKGFSVVLDENGKSLSSLKLAEFIEKRMVNGTPSLNFAIGPAAGWSDDIKKRADLTLSLSALTFPHQMVRLILLEQIYRAFTIIRGEPYHKQ